MARVWCLALAALVLMSSVASAGIQLRQGASTTTLGVLSPPVTLAAGATGLTTLGANLTTASTIKIASNRADEVLRVELKAPKTQLVSIRLVSTTGLANINKAIVTVGGATQVHIANGVVTQSTGSAATLGASGLSVTGSFKVSTHALTPTITMDIESRPSANGPLSKERWVVTLT